MCCFSGRVEKVANTRIYARPSTGNRQYLVYSMQYEAKADLAMILPLPVARRTAEDEVQFINLETYPGFFEDLKSGFPETAQSLRSKTWSEHSSGESPKLKVLQVGSFSASFVPTVKDFGRLDARFRLPAGTWESLPDYQDFGFAVFKLDSQAQQVHPMAFEFPRRHSSQLFFPTVHIHDGKVHRAAEFDHDLYCQLDEVSKNQRRELMFWKESSLQAGEFMTQPLPPGLMNLKQHCYRGHIVGKYKNIDVVL